MFAAAWGPWNLPVESRERAKQPKELPEDLQKLPKDSVGSLFPRKKNETIFMEIPAEIPTAIPMGIPVGIRKGEFLRSFPWEFLGESSRDACLQNRLWAPTTTLWDLPELSQGSLRGPPDLHQSC